MRREPRSEPKGIPTYRVKQRKKSTKEGEESNGGDEARSQTRGRKMVKEEGMIIKTSAAQRLRKTIMWVTSEKLDSERSRNK